jgi:hypothetical protein
MIHERGIDRNAGMPFEDQRFTPTISVFPHTTLGNVAIPLNTFKSRGHDTVQGNLYDTPGVQGDSAFLASLISHEYARSISLQKLGGFSRPAEMLEAGTFPHLLPLPLPNSQLITFHV